MTFQISAQKIYKVNREKKKTKSDVQKEHSSHLYDSLKLPEPTDPYGATGRTKRNGNGAEQHHLQRCKAHGQYKHTKWYRISVTTNQTLSTQTRSQVTASRQQFIYQPTKLFGWFECASAKEPNAFQNRLRLANRGALILYLPINSTHKHTRALTPPSSTPT